MQSTIDTHIHVWNLEQVDYPWLKGNTSILSRTYALDELETGRQAAGITGGILIQAANSLEETAWMIKSAQHPWIKGVVGWLPLKDTDTTAQIIDTAYRPGKLL